jgi:hypothetical protein
MQKKGLPREYMVSTFRREDKTEDICNYDTG